MVVFCCNKRKVFIMNKIIRNAIKCNLCGDVIESKSTHDFVSCKCGACAVDGGTEYLRWLAPDRNSFTDLSEVIETEEES